MAEISEIDEVRYQRDTCRGRCLELERDNERLAQLLGYAEQAIKAEYQRSVRAR